MGEVVVEGDRSSSSTGKGVGCSGCSSGGGRGKPWGKEVKR